MPKRISPKQNANGTQQTESRLSLSNSSSIKEQSAAEMWDIEARAFSIPYTPFTHNFWALLNSDHCVVEQLHGLAVDPRTGRTQAVGNSSHLLQVIHRTDIVWALQPNQPSVVCATGLETQVRLRWQAALDAMLEINALCLPYPDWWQHAYKENSNSVFTTLGLIMGFSEPQTLLATLAPGVKLVISEEIITRHSYQELVDRA